MTTKLLNIDILESKASMKKLVELTEGDREKLVELIEPEPHERVRIQQELGRVSTDSNHYFLRAPLMIRIIIDLIIVRKVNIQNVKNSSEMYLMVKMKNLDFNTNSNTNFTELDPPEDQDYLIDVLKLCQMQIQSNSNKVESINIIRGIQRNIKILGQCFEAKVPGETISIPVEFIKKLGIFDYRKDGGDAYLEVIHLSFLESCCAASLCRHDVDIQQELAKIKDPERFKAVTIFIAGLLAENSTVEFLNMCKSLGRNLLDLLKNQEREKSAEVGGGGVIEQNC